MPLVNKANCGEMEMHFLWAGSPVSHQGVLLGQSSLLELAALQRSSADVLPGRRAHWGWIPHAL